MSLLMINNHTDRVFVEVERDWRRGSVVRTSVFSWRTFPDLWPLCA